MAASSMGFRRPTTTPTPDEIFDVWLSRLTGSELKVLLYIVRRTLGFKKDADHISLTQICEGIITREGKVLDRGTGLSRTTVSRAVRSLESLGLIVVRRSQEADGENETNCYRLRFRGFDENDDPADDSGDGSEAGGSQSGPGVVQKSDYPGSKSRPPIVQKPDPQQTESQETDSQQTGPESAPPESDASQQADNRPGGAGGVLADEGDPVSSTRTGPDPDRAAEAVEQLVVFGVFRRRATALVESLSLSPEKVERACAVLGAEVEAGAKIANKAAVLVSRLEAGWEPPQPENSDVPTGGDEWDAPPPAKSRRPALPEVVDVQGRHHDAYGWFEIVKQELALQLPRETYETWLRPAELESYQPPGDDTPPVITIRLHNLYAHEWVEHRLDRVIGRLLTRLLGAEVERRYTTRGVDDEAGAPQAA